MDSASTISLDIAGRRFPTWKSASIIFDMETLVTRATFNLYDPDALFSIGGDDFVTGQPCAVSIINNLRTAPDQVLDGYIIRRRRGLSGSRNVLTVEVADKLVDLLDCSAIHKSRTWIRKPFSFIIRDLLFPFSLTLDSTALQTDPVITKFTLQSGESAFDAIERLCRAQAVLPLSSLTGTLVLGNSASLAERSAEDLEVGVNIKELDEEVDWSEQFSEITVLGQSSGDGKRWTKEMLQAAATARDTGVTRYRPKVIISENKATRELLIKRVNWETQVRSGRATTYVATVRGWYQKNRAGVPMVLWQKNQRVNLRCAEWGLNEERLITKVELTIGDGGELAKLTLKHPDIFSAQPGLVVDLT